MTEKNKIILIGDIHGEFGSLRNKIKNNISDAYIIQVGDFGLGFHKPNFYKDKFTWLNDVLVDKNCHLYVIRGNHDDPSYFAETNSPESDITLLKDYSELKLLGKSILLVGGAVSIDRRFRIEGVTWWSDEDFNLKLEHQFPYKDRQYDLVVTHTRPGVCGSFKGFDNIKHWCDQDSDLKNDLIEESQKLDYLYKMTKPKYFYYGHFHQSLTVNYEDTEFRCLNIDEAYMPFCV
jgi:DNA repair exonuclease SbcCD nuclease subunit